MERVRILSRAFNDIVPRNPLLEGFQFEGARVPLSSFQKGIHRARVQRGPAALSLLTAAPKSGRPRPYDDIVDLDARSITYHYRSGSIDQADNRALRAAFVEQVPLIYFLGVDAGQYQVVWPIFVTDDDPLARMVTLEVGLPVRDLTDQGLQTPPDTRRYALAQVARRYHQARFRRDVLHAYRDRCAICSLREPQLVEASHIIRDVDEDGVAAVVNGIALCAIHHLAYDRNLLGIDPERVVHIKRRLLEQTDGPMLSSGIQGFEGATLLDPRQSGDRPDPVRLAVRFDEFHAAS
jgi:putative restriction endonuclease